MTADPAALLALADEIEALDGPSREMDAFAMAALHKGLSVVSSWHGRVSIKGPDETTRDPPNLTGSVDAVLELMAEALPGHVWSGCSCSMPNGKATSSIRYNGRGPHGYIAPVNGAAPTLPLAILAALLRAVAARTPAT